MIFPILAGVHALMRAPVTWALLLLNLFVFAITFQQSEISQTALEDYMRDPTFSETQGVVFAKFIQSHPERYPASMKMLATQSQGSLQGERRQLLGGLSMRDSLFLADAQKMVSPLDEVARSWWVQKFSDLQTLRDAHPSYALGLTQTSQNFMSVITYQFTHSGFSHFIGNMLFFLIFASTLETMIGGLAVLVLYLMCGVFAALSFLLMSEASAVPLIGASGAISGLMAFFCVLMWRTKVRYAYFLFLPRRDFAGIVNLPAWVTLILWMLSDLAGHWATPSELGGIAYSAHLGGQACGIIAALVFIAIRKYRGVPLPEGTIAVASKTETVHSAIVGQSA